MVKQEAQQQQQQQIVTPLLDQLMTKGMVLDSLTLDPVSAAAGQCQVGVRSTGWAACGL
jgi:hypothetical protein